MRRVGVAVLTVLVLVGTATGSGASGLPRARVSPHLDIKDGHVIVVHWHDFLPARTGGDFHEIFVAECSRAFTPDAATLASYNRHCTERYQRGSVRHGDWPGQLRAGVVGNVGETCGTTPDDLDGCEFAVLDINYPAHVIDVAAVAPFTFRAPKSA